RGPPDARPLHARPRARRSGRRPAPSRGSALRPRGARDPRPDRVGRVRRAGAAASPGARGGGAAHVEGALAMTATALARPSVDAAYEHCAAVTRRAHSNFYWGFRLLPGERRRSLTAVYAFCRAADDMADDAGMRTDPARLIARWREE